MTAGKSVRVSVNMASRRYGMAGVASRTARGIGTAG